MGNFAIGFYLRERVRTAEIDDPIFRTRRIDSYQKGLRDEFGDMSPRDLALYLARNSDDKRAHDYINTVGPSNLSQQVLSEQERIKVEE